MMEVDSIKIRRVGNEDDPNAEVVVEIQDIHGDWHEVGRENVNSNFSTCWSLPKGMQAGR